MSETKPAMEWVNGRALQKVSPQRKHALAQGTFFSALYAWAMQEGSGRVGTEWEFRIAPHGEVRRPLVPDVAYLSYDRVSYESAAEADIPRVALIFLVDTAAQTVTARTKSGQRIFGAAEDLADNALPGFSMPVRSLFAEPRPKQR